VSDTTDAEALESQATAEPDVSTPPDPAPATVPAKRTQPAKRAAAAKEPVKRAAKAPAKRTTKRAPRKRAQRPQTGTVAAEPIVITPVVTTPVVTEPVVAASLVAEPADPDTTVTDPAVSESVVTEPAVTTEAVTTEAVATEAVAAEPALRQPPADAGETEQLPEPTGAGPEPAATQDAPGKPSRTRAARPFWRLAWSRSALELKMFFRERVAVIFTFALPTVLLLLLGPIFNSQDLGGGISAGQLLVAGMLGGGIGSTSFVNLGIGITSDREDGTLKRLRRAPMPPAAYFIGKITLVLVTSLVEVALVVTVGELAFGLRLPNDPGRWFTFVWVYLLGVTACSLLGIAISSLPRSVRSAAPVINLPFLVLQFISGIFVVPITDLPQPFQQAAAFFPLKWLTQGFRSVFLPDAAVALEPAGAWEHGRTALVLGAWCIGGLILCLTTFRWQGRRDG
jgi:ABC-2 type transport system permease protein